MITLKNETSLHIQNLKWSCVHHDLFRYVHYDLLRYHSPRGLHLRHLVRPGTYVIEGKASS